MLLIELYSGISLQSIIDSWQKREINQSIMFPFHVIKDKLIVKKLPLVCCKTRTFIDEMVEGFIRLQAESTLWIDIRIDETSKIEKRVMSGDDPDKPC